MVNTRVVDDLDIWAGPLDGLRCPGNVPAFVVADRGDGYTAPVLHRYVRTQDDTGERFFRFDGQIPLDQG